MEKEILEEVLHRFNGKSSAGLQHACETYVATGEEPNGLGRHAGGVWLLLKELLDEEKQNEVLKKELSEWRSGKKKVIRLETVECEEKEDKDVSITAVVQNEKETPNREEFSREKTTSSSDGDAFSYENLKSEKAKRVLTMSYGKLLKWVPKEIWKEVSETELETMGEAGLRRKMVEYCELQERLSSDVLKYFNDRIPTELCHKIHKVHSIRGTRLKNVMHILSSIGVERTHTLIDVFFHSNFLMGVNSNGWVANFYWLFRGDNFLKVLEGRYDNLYQNRQKQDVHHSNEADGEQHFEGIMNSSKEKKRYRRSALMEENKMLRDALREAQRKNSIFEGKGGIKREVDGILEWMQKARGVRRRPVFNEDHADEDHEDEQPREDNDQLLTPEVLVKDAKEEKGKDDKFRFEEK